MKNAIVLGLIALSLVACSKQEEVVTPVAAESSASSVEAAPVADAASSTAPVDAAPTTSEGSTKPVAIK